MDKLNKAIDTLKLQTAKKKDGPVSHKDKILLCQQMFEGIQNATVKQSADYGKLFSSSCETLFTLCDDAHSDVRIVAEECLNGVIRNSLAEGNATRVHVELYKEIRRNGAARSLRSALMKFAELSDQIRPQKCRMFAFNLVPCLTAVARRPEDSIYECFGAASSKIFASLGQFYSEEETKILIKSILPNLQLTSAPARRSASSFLVDLCRHTRKKQFFTAYLLKSLLDTLVPVQLDQSPQQILGTLTALRTMTPLIKECDDNDVGEVRHVQTGAIRVNPQISVTIDQLLQFYEITLYYVCYPNNSVATCALETLSAFLQNLPIRLIKILQSNDGLEKSRIFSIPSLNSGLGPKSRKSSFTGLSSGLSSIGGSQTDLSFSVGSLSIDNDDGNLFPEIISSSDNLFPETSTSPEENSEKKENELFPIESNNYAGPTIGDDDADDDSDVEENSLSDPLGIGIKSKTEDGNLVTYKNKRVLELGGLTKVAADDEKLFSEPSTPLSPEGQGVFVSFPDDIGNFTDEENPLKYCCRLLCRKFLLSNEIGTLIADRDVRVSQKVLALNCVQSLCSLDPSLIGLSVTKIQLNGGQKIKDIFLYSSHSDHLLRGETACFVGAWLKCEFISSRFRSTYGSYEPAMFDYFLKIIENMLSDQHFLAARSALLALKTCQNEILLWTDTISTNTVLKLFDAALATLRHSYWTVKLALLEMWSSLNFCVLRRCELQQDSFSAEKTSGAYQSKVLTAIADDLLADENVRVRQEAASTLSSLVKSICFVNLWDSAKFVRTFEQQSRTPTEFFWYHTDFSKIHNLSPSYDQRTPKQLTSWQEENLSYVVVLLYRTLATSKDQFHLSGLTNALSKLSEIYAPSQYFQSWSTFLTDYDTGAAHMSSLLQLLNTAVGTEAITLHQVLMNLLGNLFAGYASRQLSKSNTTTIDRWPLLANQQLGEFASELNLHCLRILSVYWHVCSDTVPSPPPMITKPPMPQISHQSLPGAGNVAQMIKSKLDGNKVHEKNELANQPPPPSQLVSKAKVGDYYNIGHLLRLYEMVKGGWTNYKTSLDADVSERFVGLLRSCLRCLSVILEIASLTDVEKISEEILLYVKPLMAVLPSEVVITVTQVLKSLFGTNLSLSVRPDSGAIAGVPSSTSYLSVMNVPSSLYQMCIVKPRTKFAQSMAAAAARHDLLSDPLNKHLGWFGSRADKHVVNLLKKPAHKTILTNYIRLFEPIVVQALRFYTSSVGVDLQRSVINLLIQLVQIRVNYCLLDSDQRFLNFLFQQLENIEEAVLTNANDLVQSLFEFFIILSYEKYQNKTVLDVPKILQLADALLASGLNKNLGISALHCVVVDLFLLRPAAKLESPKDLEIQQECVISVLMKSINCVQALDLFTFILYRTRRENEAKWRKLSRDIVDILLPFMSKGQFPFENFESFQTVVNFLDFLCPGAFRPVDSILELFFSCPPTNCTDVERFCKWLSVEYVCFHAVVMHCREDAILSRLEVIPVSIQFDAKFCQSLRSSSPPQLTTPSASIPQDSIAQLLLSICDLSLYELSHYRRSLPSTSVNFLERLILRYLQLATHVCQSGAFRKISASLSSQFVNKWTTDVSLLTKFSPQIVVQFFYLLSSVHVYNDRFWLKFISNDENQNNIILRQIVRILYADHVKAELMNGDTSTIENKWSFENTVELIDEPPVSELVGILQRCYPTSLLFLKVVENCVLQQKILPRKCVKVLKCLDSLHYNLSLDVLQLLLKCLESPYVTVRQTASTMASRKIELILINRTSNDTSVKITEQQIQDIVRKLDSFKMKKFTHLRNLVLKLASSYSLKISPPSTATDETNNDDDICTALIKPSLKKPKFIQVLQSVIRRRFVDAKNVAQILAAVSVDEASELLSDWTVKGDILESCILRDAVAVANDDLGSPNGSPSSDERSSVAVAACRALIAGIRTLFLKFPKDFRVDFDGKSFRFDPSLDVCLRESSERLFDYASAVRALWENNHLVKSLTDADLQILTKFCCFLTAAALSLHSEITLVQALNAGECLISCFVCERSWSTLCSNDFLKMQPILIGCVFWNVVKLYKFPDVFSTNVELPEIVGVDDNRMVFWSYVHSMLVFLEKQSLEFNKFSDVLFSLTKKLIVGVARLPYVTSFSRVPMSIFKYGWAPNVKQTSDGNLILPTIPVRYLQNVDSLHDFMFRVNLLGWTSRKDFEEIWMGLLGVLSATPIGQELQSNSAQEITNRVCASAVAVRCISSLLLQSLLYPTPGRPILSKFISKHREKQSTFLKTNSGQRLCELKRKISRSIVTDLPNFQRRTSSYGRNIERLHNNFDYAVGQFSIDTLWSLTGILAEEESLVSSNSSITSSDLHSKPHINVDLAPAASSSTSASASIDEHDGKVIYLEEPPPGIVMKRSASNFILSSEGELNLSSCFQFLLEELFGHWLANGSDAVPLPLLSATVEAVVLLSDLFHQRYQYEWLREKLSSLNQQRTSEDELLLQDVALGLLKASAVLGMNDAEKEKETLNFIDTGLNKRELSIRISTLQGAMYVLQTLTSDEIVGLMPILSEYILTHLTSYVVGDSEKLISDKPQSVDHQLILWAVGCFIIESFHDPHTKQSFAPKFFDVCIKALNNRNLPFVLIKSVVCGVESLLINSSLDVKSLGQLAKLATDSIQQSDSSEITILFVELLLTCLYTAKENRRSDELTLTENETAPRNAGEPTLSAMERLSVLLNRITKGNRKEASVIGQILPSFLSDNFSPGDVMNKIITELLHPSQPHPEIIIKILHSLIESLLRQEATTVVCDWILLSMPSFTHKNPWQFAVWCLTCLLLSASSNVYVKNLWSVAHCRLGQSEQLDVSLFCLAVENFCCQLEERSQLESFLLTMNEAANRNSTSFYCRARDIITNYCNLPLKN